MSSPEFTFATARLGPRNRGRDYGVLRLSGVTLSRSAKERLDDFALSLIGLTKAPRRPAAVMFPLQPGRYYLLARVDYVGEEKLGAAVCANAIVAPVEALEICGWRSDALLDLIPPATDADFGHAPITDCWNDEPEPEFSGVQPEAAFRDQRVDIGAFDAEFVLERLLAAIRPASQRARIDGWTTSPAFSANGVFQPRDLFRLVLHATGENTAAFAATHMATTADAAAKAAPEPHPSWQTWSRIRSVKGRGGGVVAKLAWNPAWVSMTPTALAERLLLHAGLDYPLDHQLELVRGAASAAAGEDDASRALQDALVPVVERLSAQTPASEAKFVKAVLSAPRPAVRNIDGLVALALSPEVAPTLGSEAATLGEDRIAEYWQSRLTTSGDDYLFDIAPTLLKPVLAHLLTRLPEEAELFQLSARICRALARGGKPMSQWSQALEALINVNQPSADLELADRELFRSVPQVLGERIARRALAAPLTQADDPEVIYRALNSYLWLCERNKGAA